MTGISGSQPWQLLNNHQLCPLTIQTIVGKASIALNQPLNYICGYVNTEGLAQFTRINLFIIKWTRLLIMRRITRSQREKFCDFHSGVVASILVQAIWFVHRQRSGRVSAFQRPIEQEKIQMGGIHSGFPLHCSSNPAALIKSTFNSFKQEPTKMQLPSRR